MARPRFSEMLVRRRRQLGLSTAQASQVLKIKEQVLVAFEEGDFESIPKSGYAQGMLSSYARYLGLNARQLVDVFQEELYEYVNGEQSHELRRRTRNVSSGRDLEGYETVNEAQSRPKAYVGAKGLLPTSGGPAGDYGEFATTSKASPRGSSVQLVNSSRTTSLYATGNTSYVRGATYDANNTAAMGSHSQFVNGHSNNAREREAQETRRQGSAQARTRRRGAASRGSGAGRGYDDLRRENVRTRRATSSREREGVVESYEPATSAEARRRSRSANAQAPARPNVRRDGERQYRGSSARRGEGSRRQGGGRGRGSRSGPRDARGIGLILVLAVTVILTVTLILSVQSCTSQREAEQPTSVPVATTSTSGTVDTSADASSSSSRDTSATGTTSDAEDTEDASDATSSTSSRTTTSTSETDETDDAAASTQAADTVEVVVEVESGQQAWIEVTVDGVSQVADRYTGPWSATFEVSDSATIQADNTAAVSVTADGVSQTFSSKASGVGSMTIEAPKSEAVDDDASTGETDTSDGATSDTDASAATSY